MAKAADKRPPVAVGHVHLPVKNVPETSAFLQGLGLRAVFENEKQTFAVLELRGGTHLIVEKSRKRIQPGDRAPVDFMVDDIKRVEKRIGGAEKEKLDVYLEGFESLRERRRPIARPILHRSRF